METEGIVNELVVLVVGALKGTVLKNVSCDVGYVKRVLIPVVQATMSRLEKTKTDKILKFIKNSPVLNQCIVPNVAQIMADGDVIAVMWCNT